MSVSLARGASDALIFWRIIQGVGGGALIPTSQAILYEAFPREEVGTAMALFGLGVMVGPTIGPTLGGFLTDNYSWPWIFYINLPIGLAAALMVSIYVKDSPHQERASTIDYIGIGLLIVCVGSLQYLVEHGQRDDWFQSSFITSLAIIGVVTGVMLVWRELTIKEPVIDFRVLRHRDVWIGVIIGVVFGVGLFGSVFVLPIFLQNMLHMTAWQTGMVILPGAIMTAVSMAITGRISNKVDARLMIGLGTVMFFCSMWRLPHLTAESGTHDFFWPLVWRGLGLGFMFVPLTNITLADLSPRELPTGAAISNFFRQLGGSFGVAAMATLLTRFTVQAQAAIGSHVSIYDLATQQRLQAITGALMSRGIDPATAQQMAIGSIGRAIGTQASVIGFSRVYLLSGFILLATMPLLLLVKNTMPGSGAPKVHAD